MTDGAATDRESMDVRAERGPETRTLEALENELRANRIELADSHRLRGNLYRNAFAIAASMLLMLLIGAGATAYSFSSDVYRLREQLENLKPQDPHPTDLQVERLIGAFAASLEPRVVEVRLASESSGGAVAPTVIEVRHVAVPAAARPPFPNSPKKP
jgi:hypothetical protein